MRLDALRGERAETAVEIGGDRDGVVVFVEEGESLRALGRRVEGALRQIVGIDGADADLPENHCRR